MSTTPVWTANQWLTERALSTQATTPARMAKTAAKRAISCALMSASSNVIHGRSCRAASTPLVDITRGLLLRHDDLFCAYAAEQLETLWAGLPKI